MRTKITISPITWVLVISAIVIAGYSYWFYSNFDKVIEEKDLGPIKEVKANPFFAAEKFLAEVGKSASTHKNFSILDQQLESTDTVIIESSRVGLSESKRNSINDWIEAGGHLIVLATEIYDDEKGTSRDILLDELGIRLYENYNYSWDNEDGDNLATFVFEDTDVETSVDFSLDFYLQDNSGDATFVGGNEYSDLFAQYQQGDGMISVVTDMNIWKNWYIDDRDHAMFLYQLVGGGENVIFLYNTIQPSLLSLMFERIPMIVISFLAIIGVFLFSYSWRKGPPKSDLIISQREIMQHIEAAGEFSFRNDNGRRLLKALTQTLEVRLRKSIHNYSKLEPKDQITKLYHLTGINRNELEILWHDSDLNQDNFVKKLILIQRIRKLL